MNPDHIKHILPSHEPANRLPQKRRRNWARDFFQGVGRRVFPAAVFLFIVGFAVLELRAQSQPEASAPAAAKSEKPSAKDKTFWEVIQQGGFMMIPLGLTSVTMIALVIDGLVRLRNDKLAPPALVDQVRAHFRTGDYNGAYKVCKEHPNLFTNVVRVGLGLLGHGKEATERAMEDTLAKEVSALGTRIRYLSVIGVVSPMLGLTGTVLGMIRAFATIGSSGIGDPSALAAAIGEVLVATATGLFVAIPAFAFYYVFSNRVTSVTAFCEEMISSLFRGMPYPELAGLEIGDEPIYAAPPHPDLLMRTAATRELTEQAEEPAPAPAPAAAAASAPDLEAYPAARVAQPRLRKPKQPAVVAQVPCPNCRQIVAVGAAECPHCQIELEWGTASR